LRGTDHKPPPGPQRAHLKAREYKVELDAKLNKHVVVAANAPLSQQPGYYCDVCDCTLRDSINYLDHINGKRRTRAARHRAAGHGRRRRT